MVAKSTPLAQTMGVLNAVTIDGDAVGALTLVGPGAGGDATASAVAADLADIARGAVAPAFGRPVAALVDARARFAAAPRGRLLRPALRARPPGVDGDDRANAWPSARSRWNRSCRSARGGDGSAYVSVVIVTHATTETSIREALALTLEDGVVREKPQVIRIERP